MKLVEQKIALRAQGLSYHPNKTKSLHLQRFLCFILFTYYKPGKIKNNISDKLLMELAGYFIIHRCNVLQKNRISVVLKITLFK